MFKELLTKLLGKKEESKIPTDSVECFLCKRIVKREKASISLPEGCWVCDECFFVQAE